MNRKAKIAISIGFGLLAMTAVYWFLNNRDSAQQIYASESSMTTVVLKPYNGRYKDDPEVQKFIRTFNSRVKRHLHDIAKKTGLKPPGTTVTIELDDSFENEPFEKPTASTSCSPMPFTEQNGNCRGYEFKMGAKAIAGGYKGRTTADQILEHELTHIFMLFNIPNHDDLPKHIIEGIPIHVAGQEDQIRKVHNNIKVKPATDYKPGEIPVHTYSEIINEYERNYGKDTSILAD